MNMKLPANITNNDTDKIAEDKKKINAIYAIIDTFSDDTLSLLSKDILKRIVYFNIANGEYIHLPKTINSYYQEIATPNEIAVVLALLTLDGWVVEGARKTIYKGKYVTQKYYNVNYEKIYKV